MIVPSLPSQHFRTFEIVSPIPTHWRPAGCEEFECGAWRNGWKTIVPASSPQADYIRAAGHGRRFQETTAFDGSGMAEFMFAPGQKCFAAASHRVPLEREPIYIARGGDARANPSRERRIHTRPADWVEEFAEHQDRVKKSREG